MQNSPLTTLHQLAPTPKPTSINQGEGTGGPSATRERGGEGRGATGLWEKWEGAGLRGKRGLRLYGEGEGGKERAFCARGRGRVGEGRRPTALWEREREREGEGRGRGELVGRIRQNGIRRNGTEPLLE